MSFPPVLPHSVLYDASIALTASTFVAGISWGVMTSLYSGCMFNLIRDLRPSKYTRKTALLASWITVMWILSSLSTLANAYATLSAYSWKMDYPGQPIVFLAQEWNAPIAVLAYSTYILAMWFADAMVLWRAFVISTGIQAVTRALILSFLSLIYLAIVGTGCYTMALLHTDTTLYTDFTMKAAIPCFSLSVALNVLATTFIITRLYVFRKLSEQAMGRKDATPYTSIATMLVESMALYAVWSLVFIITYAINNPGEYIMLMTLGNVQVIAPVLVIYRVSRGKGWEQTSTRIDLSTPRRVTFSESRAKSTIRDTEFHNELSAGLKRENYDS